MIAPISSNYGNYSNISSKNPSFGMARLNELGRQSEDSFGYKANTFVDASLYRKPGIFSQPAIKDKLGEENFADICQNYGCTNNSEANAEFIEYQILNRKAEKVISSVDDDSRIKGLTALYLSNYDNPELSTEDTKALLAKLKDSMAAEAYIQQVGVMNAGTTKKGKK